MITRRSVAKSTLALPLVYSQMRSERMQAATPYDDDCGVASGNPTPTSVVLWTRIPVSSRQHVGETESIPVKWEVATSPLFEPAALVTHGETLTDESCDFTVAVLAEGLEPFSTYYYRFASASGYESVVGRAKTAPAAGSRPESLRFATVSCQQFSMGYYTAYLHLVQEDVDYCLHLGDHIYEIELGGVRSDVLGGKEARTLDDYRAKYRHYLSDPAWREARRLFTWIDVWDDHEVFNDYAGAVDRRQDPERFSGAYQAFLEYMPMLANLTHDAEGVPELQLYRSLCFGDLVELILLDERQYRLPNPCSRSYFSRGCSDMRVPEHSMLGLEQRAWTKETLGASRATWKLLLSEVMLSPLRLSIFERESDGLAQLMFDAPATEGGLYLNLDGWDGYPAERHDLLSFVEQNSVENLVVVTGDIHAAVNGHLFADSDRSQGKAQAVEIITTSISSTSIGERTNGMFGRSVESVVRSSNPHLAWMDFKHHGYTVLTFSDEGMSVRHMAVDSVKRPVAAVREVRRSAVATGSGRISG